MLLGYVLLVAVNSDQHWRGLGTAIRLTDLIVMIGPLLEVGLLPECGRFEVRKAIDVVVRPWVARCGSVEATELLAEVGVLVCGFQTSEEIVTTNPRC